MKKIIVLTDGKAGHENQSKALARALGCDFELVPVAFKSPFAKALSYLFDRLGIHTQSLFKHSVTSSGNASCFMLHASCSEDRDIVAVLGTGSGTFYAAKTLARKLGVKCGVVLYPRGYRLSTFDAVLAPSFDRPKRAKNVIEIPANLVANDEEFYSKGVAAFRERTTVTPDIAVIIGGPNKCSTMSVEWMKKELDAIFRLPGAKAVTTSRRTPPEVESLVDSYPWDYRLLYSKDHFNPIPAFVKLAKDLYVTAESTGMLSEAATCGSARVHALDNLNPGPHKFRRFVENLRAAGYVDSNRKVDLSAEIARAKELLGV